MKTENAVVVRTYTTQQSADMAVLELASCGIEADLVTDNAGGAYPFLDLTNGVAVVVEKQQEAEAKRILEQMSTAEDAIPPVVGSVRSPKKSTPFLLGLLVGALLTCMGWWAYTHWYQKSIVKTYDKKGRVKETFYYSGGVLEKSEQDRNGDGKVDAWFIYNPGELGFASMDDNFDGEVDCWVTYTDDFGYIWEKDQNFDGKPDAKAVYAHGIPQEEWYDTDFNGVFDVHAEYKNGVTTRLNVTPNGTNIVFRQEIYKDGVQKEVWIDENMDGTFDIKKVYDPMGKELSATRLHEEARSKSSEPAR